MATKQSVPDAPPVRTILRKNRHPL
jgi:thioredoxin-related protein